MQDGQPPFLKLTATQTRIPIDGPVPQRTERVERNISSPSLSSSDTSHSEYDWMQTQSWPLKNFRKRIRSVCDDKHSWKQQEFGWNYGLIRTASEESVVLVITDNPVVSSANRISLTGPAKSRTQSGSNDFLKTDPKPSWISQGFHLLNSRRKDLKAPGLCANPGVCLADATEDAILINLLEVDDITKNYLRIGEEGLLPDDEISNFELPQPAFRVFRDQAVKSSNLNAIQGSRASNHSKSPPISENYEDHKQSRNSHDSTVSERSPPSIQAKIFSPQPSRRAQWHQPQSSSQDPSESNESVPRSLLFEQLHSSVSLPFSNSPPSSVELGTPKPLLSPNTITPEFHPTQCHLLPGTELVLPPRLPTFSPISSNIFRSSSKTSVSSRDRNSFNSKQTSYPDLTSSATLSQFGFSPTLDNSHNENALDGKNTIIPGAGPPSPVTCSCVPGPSA